MAKYPTNYPTVDENHYNYAPPQQAYLGNPSDAHIPQAKPVYVPPGQDKVGKWTASLFGCFGDCGVCEFIGSLVFPVSYTSSFLRSVRSPYALPLLLNPLVAVPETFDPYAYKPCAVKN